MLIAAGGLVLAFAAAVLSTVAREAGNVFAMALLASLALLLAGFVALTTVPYLARRAFSSRARDVVDYDVTREGLIYLALALAIGVAALNTGNNLLFIIVSAMLAAIVVSGAASAMVLRALELDLPLPEHVFAGSPSSARIVVRNKRRFLPSFSVSVVPIGVPVRRRRVRLERSSFRFPWWRGRDRHWFRVPDLTLRWRADAPPPTPILPHPVYFPFIPARATVTTEVQLTFARRGHHEQAGMGLATRFPFSFLLKTRKLELPRKLIVYPSVEPTDSSLEVLPMITGEFEAFLRGRGYDLYRIREYMPEDPRRHVDWKATAKTGELKVREFTREDERKLRIVFDNPAPGVVSEAEYENGVETAASLAWHFAAEHTELSFAATGCAPGADIYDFLRYLALVQPRAAPSVLEKLEVTDDYNLVITARPRGSIPTALWTSSYIIFLNGPRLPSA